MCFAPQQRALFRDLNLQKWREHVVFCTFWLRNVLCATTACAFSTSQLPKVVREWCILYILTWKCASHHNGVQLFISHLASWLRTRRFSEPTCQPSGATKPRKKKHSVSRFFLLIFSLLILLPADCFFISPYCRKFDFQTSFDYTTLTLKVYKNIYNWRKKENWSTNGISAHVWLTCAELRLLFTAG